MGFENPVHLIFLAAVALIFLGPKRLPELARAAGRGMREFRAAIDGEADEQVEDAVVVDDPAHRAAADAVGPTVPASAPLGPAAAPESAATGPAVAPGSAPPGPVPAPGSAAAAGDPAHRVGSPDASDRRSL